MTATAYITRIPVDSDEPKAPENWFRVHVNGIEIVKSRTPAGRPRYFTKIDAALAAAYEALSDAGVPAGTQVRWTPQYDSSWAEALGEWCGYVGTAT